MLENVSAKNHLNQHKSWQRSIIISDQELIGVSGQPGSSSALPLTPCVPLPRSAGLPTDLFALLDPDLLLHHGPVHQALRGEAAAGGPDPALHLLPGHRAHPQHPGSSQCEFSPLAGGSGGCPTSPERSKPHSLPFLAVPS